MSEELVREYFNGDLAVVWKPQLCIHAGKCVNALPNVYKPDEKPWISAQNATHQELKDQIAMCPSGALSYYMKGEENEDLQTLETKVEVSENGPLLVSGPFQMIHTNGKEEVKNQITAFCRCGVSRNKPYCDGSHVEAEFKE